MGVHLTLEVFFFFYNLYSQSYCINQDEKKKKIPKVPNHINPQRHQKVTFSLFSCEAPRQATEDLREVALLTSPVSSLPASTRLPSNMCLLSHFSVPGITQAAP